jgi:hypothetical protein
LDAMVAPLLAVAALLVLVVKAFEAADSIGD